MKKHFNNIVLVSLMWFLPLLGKASTIVKGPVTLGNSVIQAEYVIPMFNLSCYVCLFYTHYYVISVSVTIIS